MSPALPAGANSDPHGARSPQPRAPESPSLTLIHTIKDCREACYCDNV